jgi:hypothetical protein
MLLAIGAAWQAPALAQAPTPAPAPQQALGGPAAQDRPPRPSARDVAVEYTLQGSDSPTGPTRTRPLKVYWAKGGAKIRIEMGDERSNVVPDRDSRRVTMALLDQQVTSRRATTRSARPASRCPRTCRWRVAAA